MLILEVNHYRSSVELNILSISLITYCSELVLKSAFQPNTMANVNSELLQLLRASSAIWIEKWLSKLLDLPIADLSIFTTFWSDLASEFSHSNFILAEQLRSAMPAYTEWPLLITTLRLSVAGIFG